MTVYVYCETFQSPVCLVNSTTDYRPGNVVACVVLAVHKGWDTANYHDITGEVLLVGSCTYLPRMDNASLSQGRLLVSEKHASNTPLPKKPRLDSSDMNNFRPLSNLSFILKVVAVTSQLHQYLATNNLLPRFQSAYRKSHSTETAMQRVWSDIHVLMTADDTAGTAGPLSSFQLRWPLHTSRSPAVCCCSVWFSPWLASVIFDRQNAADRLQWSTICCAVWC